MDKAERNYTEELYICAALIRCTMPIEGRGQYTNKYEEGVSGKIHALVGRYIEIFQQNKAEQPKRNILFKFMHSGHKDEYEMLKIQLRSMDANFERRNSPEVQMGFFRETAQMKLEQIRGELGQAKFEDMARATVSRMGIRGQDVQEFLEHAALIAHVEPHHPPQTVHQDRIRGQVEQKRLPPGNGRV